MVGGTEHVELSLVRLFSRMCYACALFGMHAAWMPAGTASITFMSLLACNAYSRLVFCDTRVHAQDIMRVVIQCRVH